MVEDPRKMKRIIENAKPSKLRKIWKIFWKILFFALNRAYIVGLILLTFGLAINSWSIGKGDYDGPRIIPEKDFYVKNKIEIPCGYIHARFGTYKNLTCTGSVLIPRRKSYGCYMSGCGSETEVLCEEDGWISKEIITEHCPNPTEIRHICCRPITHLCTWQGIWTSIRTQKSVLCQFIPDNECGKFICDEIEHKILLDFKGRCRSIYINNTYGEASCGMINFPDDTDGWYKRVDGYAAINQ